MRRSSDLDNIGLSCRLNRLNKHSRWDKWQDKVSFCSLIRFNWRVPARVPLFSLGLKAHRSGPCGHSGRLSEVLLTHYRRREVRNSIYRYREIHIDYRSKFSYRFISFISIIYGNTSIASLVQALTWCRFDAKPPVESVLRSYPLLIRYQHWFQGCSSHPWNQCWHSESHFCK